jgi:DNA repair protein RecO (recombination protein O)
MLEKATGLIIRTRRLTETSLIVHWLTPSLGRISTVAKGALRPASPFRGKLDLFYSADFTFSRNLRSELHNLREVGLREVHAQLRTDLRFLQQASYFTHLVEKSTETETPLLEIYSLFDQALLFLPRQTSAPKTVFAFELKLLDLLGVFPEANASRLRPETVKLIQELSTSDWSHLSEVASTTAADNEVRFFLERCLSAVVNRMPAERDKALGGLR